MIIIEDVENVWPEVCLSLRECSHRYISLAFFKFPTVTHIQIHYSVQLPRSHSRSIVFVWCLTISCFPHMRQLIPISPRLLDSTLVVWICTRAGTGGTMPCSCLRLYIKLGHGSKILPTATPWDNKGLSAGRAAKTLLWQHGFAYLCVHLSRECWNWVNGHLFMNRITKCWI